MTTTTADASPDFKLARSTTPAFGDQPRKIHIRESYNLGPILINQTYCGRGCPMVNWEHFQGKLAIMNCEPCFRVLRGK